MSAVLCDGCGRLSGPREAYCIACGRPLAGREVEPSEAAPPGWLVASERGQAAPVFEPLPTVPVVAADPLAPPTAWQPGWSVRKSPGAAAAQSHQAESPAPGRRDPKARALPPPPPPLPLDGAGAAVAAPPPPPLRVLYIPLLTLVLLSSAAAVMLLVLHVLRDR